MVEARCQRQPRGEFRCVKLQSRLDTVGDAAADPRFQASCRGLHRASASIGGIGGYAIYW